MLAQRLMWIAWPAFLAACVLEVIVFSVVDPHELHLSGHRLDLTRQAVYTISFFIFWIVGLGSAALATLLKSTPPPVGQCATPVADRPDGCPHRG